MEYLIRATATRNNQVVWFGTKEKPLFEEEKELILRTFQLWSLYKNIIVYINDGENWIQKRVFLKDV